MKKVGAAITLLGLALTAHAGDYDVGKGRDLLATMTSADSQQQFFAYGFIMGQVDANQYDSATGDLRVGKRGPFCRPSTASIGDIAKIVQDFLVAHPEGGKLPSGSLIYIALTRAWPCKPTK